MYVCKACKPAGAVKGLYVCINEIDRWALDTDTDLCISILSLLFSDDLPGVSVVLPVVVLLLVEVCSIKLPSF